MRKKYLAVDTTWINLEGIMVYEINQTQKDITACITCVGSQQQTKTQSPVKLIKTEIEKWLPGTGGNRKRL